MSKNWYSNCFSPTTPKKNSELAIVIYLWFQRVTNERNEKKEKKSRESLRKRYVKFPQLKL